MKLKKNDLIEDITDNDIRFGIVTKFKNNGNDVYAYWWKNFNFGERIQQWILPCHTSIKNVRKITLK